MNQSFDIYTPIRFRITFGIALGILLLALPFANILPEFVREAGGVIFVCVIAGIALIQFKQRKKIGSISLNPEQMTIQYRDVIVLFDKELLKGIVLFNVPNRYAGKEGTAIRMKAKSGGDTFTVTASQLDLAGFSKAVKEKYGYSIVVKQIPRGEWIKQFMA